MSYRKIEIAIPALADALACALENSGASAATQDAMLASGVVVEMDDGQRAWVASVAQDNPATYGTEILTAAIALDASGAVRLRTGYVPLTQVFWHCADPVTLKRRGLDAVRRDLLLQALGEAAEDDGEPDEVRALNHRWTTERSIRVVSDIVDAVAAPPADVL